ncbi:MAG: GGDEF domain-containing protein, partial [Pseudomonadota bacterium]
MRPHSPSNTIDFDTAKLQRLGFSANRGQTLRPVNLAQLRQQLNLQLQTSLEVERILELFFREVQRLVPLDALAYQHGGNDLRLELGGRANHSAGYRLSHEGEFLGELIFRRNQRFDEIELGQLESLLASLLFPLRNALLYRAAIRSALRDPLTDTGNRIAMDQALQRETDLARRSLQPLSLLMLDIDHFKRINDSFGHSMGDEVLKAVAATIKA